MTRWDSKPLKAIQITDLHQAAPGAGMYGLDIDTTQTLGRVLRQINRDVPDAELMLVTGDLADVPGADVYDRLRETLATLPMPVHCLPGNHDDPRRMREVLNPPGPDCIRMVTRGAWLLVLLDSTAPGRMDGTLGAEELAFLDDTLGRHPSHHALICLHHPVVPVGSAWLDALGLSDADAFFQVVDRHPQARGVLFGHIHQQVDIRRGDLRILGTPSTCVQFLPHSDGFALDDLPPAYRQLDLYPDGRIDTRVVYLSEVPRHAVIG